MTREERKKRAADALAISLLGANEPTMETKKLVDKYIDGEIEIPEILQKTLAKYKHKKDFN